MYFLGCPIFFFFANFNFWKWDIFGKFQSLWFEPENKFSFWYITFFQSSISIRKSHEVVCNSSTSNQFCHRNADNFLQVWNCIAAKRENVCPSIWFMTNASKTLLIERRVKIFMSNHSKWFIAEIPSFYRNKIDASEASINFSKILINRKKKSIVYLRY